MNAARSSWRKRAPFTIIELIVVVCVTAILLGMGLPAFSKLVKGQGAELAARELSAKLKGTRAYAVTNRMRVALIIPQKNFPVQGTAELSQGGTAQILNRGYQAAIIDSSNPPVFQYWVPGEKWDFLSTGVIFLETDGDAGVRLTDGKLDPENDPATTTVINGVPFTVYTSPGTNVKLNNVAAIAFHPSGRSIGGRRYVNIGEGTCFNETLTITNPGPEAYTTLTIDQFSGRVTYGKD